MKTNQQKFLLTSASIGLGIGLGYLLDYLKHKHKAQVKTITEKQELYSLNPINKIKRQQSTIQINDGSALGQFDETKSNLIKELKFLYSDDCKIIKIPHLLFQIKNKSVQLLLNPLHKSSQQQNLVESLKLIGEGFLDETAFVSPNSFIMQTTHFNQNKKVEDSKRYLRAGPRKHILHEPSKVKAAILCTQQSCAGINNIIRDLIISLENNYEVKEIYGIEYGIYEITNMKNWVKLNSQNTSDIDILNKLILKRKNVDNDVISIKKAVDMLQSQNISQIYYIGNLYDHFVCEDLYKEIRKRQLKIGICGIPASPDKEFPIIDETVGFNSEIEYNQNFLSAAYTEAHTQKSGVSIVKVCGKYSGFVNVSTCLANRDVNICLIPECKFDLYGDYGLLNFVYNKLLLKNHCIISVSEGCHHALNDAKVPEEIYDIFGNKRKKDIVKFLQEEIDNFCKSKFLIVNSVSLDATQNKYQKTTPYDQQLSEQIAQNSVHILMAGFTGCFIGHINDRSVVIPLSELSKNKEDTCIAKDSDVWQTVIKSTGQPSFLNSQE